MTEKTLLLTEENYRNGVLMDEELIGGVAETDTGTFAAYVVRYATAETVAFQEFQTLAPALEYLTTLNREWIFRQVGCGGGCGEGSCGEGGCGGHDHDDEEGCCGGHGHGDDDEGCCGKHSHDDEDEGCCGGGGHGHGEHR